MRLAWPAEDGAPSTQLPELPDLPDLPELPNDDS
jgi:hypothetical protein